MAYLGFMCIGQEIINDCRTLQRIADGAGPPGITCRACDPCCPDLNAGLGYADGYNPTSMPWYDGSQDSVDFAGLLVESVTGLEPGPFTRPVSESAGYGAVIGQGRQSAPTIVVTALVMAATCCAAEFGISWLRNALRGSCMTGVTCAGEDLTFLSCEPQTPDLDCPTTPVPFDYEAWLAPYYRTLKGAALIDGPTVIEHLARACPECNNCGIPRVTFTIAASKPCVYRDPVDLVVEARFECSTGDADDCIIWDTDGDCDGDDCPDTASCDVDPDCSSIVSPPTVPPITNPCDVDCITEEECLVCVDIPAGTFPSTGEGTLIVTVDNTRSKTPVRRLKLQLWQNPVDLDPDQLSECTVCSELNVSYLAPGAKLVIDGANGTSTIECPGGQSVRANPFISSGTGSPSFSYPSIDGCRGQHTVCLTASGPVERATFVTIQTVGREC